jgi:hypothetical protein
MGVLVYRFGSLIHFQSIGVIRSFRFMSATRLILFVPAFFWAVDLHAMPLCTHTYGSSLLNSVADGDLAAVEDEIKRLGALPPRVGADALAVSIAPISTQCRKRNADQAMYALLVKMGAEVDRPSNGVQGWGTSLMHAIDAREAEAVIQALKAGAQVNVEVDERTPLILAIRDRNVQLVKVLLEHGADPNFALGRFTPLAEAARHPGQGNEVLKLLLKHGARNRSEGIQPLDELIFYDGRPEDADETVALLLEAGGKIDGVDGGPYSDDSTPLARVVASFRTKLAVVEALLRKGADPNGRVLIYLAARRDSENEEVKRKQVLDLLYRYGARAEKARVSGYPSLREFVLAAYNDPGSREYLRELDAISLEYQLRANPAPSRR